VKSRKHFIMFAACSCVCIFIGIPLNDHAGRVSQLWIPGAAVTSELRSERIVTGALLTGFVLAAVFSLIFLIAAIKGKTRRAYPHAE
jgi:TRAP-type C4-dicarboxylate transport system permease small subunit